MRARQNRCVVLLVVALGQIDDGAASLQEDFFAVGVRGQHGSVSGQRKAQSLVRQFIELAVNIPEHEPQVGQAECSYSSTSASLTLGSPATIIASIRSTALTMLLLSLTLPASIGPPETKTTGIFRRIEAINIPGVILSQLEMQTKASAQWALTMYSTESAIRSREGRL
jgi:hypothetical protein